MAVFLSPPPFFELVIAFHLHFLLILQPFSCSLDYLNFHAFHFSFFLFFAFHLLPLLLSLFIISLSFVFCLRISLVIDQRGDLLFKTKDGFQREKVWCIIFYPFSSFSSTSLSLSLLPFTIPSYFTL